MVNPIQFIFEKESENVSKHMKDVSHGTQNRVPQCACRGYNICQFSSAARVLSPQLWAQPVLTSVDGFPNHWLITALSMGGDRRWQARNVYRGSHQHSLRKRTINEISPTTYFWALRTKCSFSSWLISRSIEGSYPQKEIIQS